MKPLEWNDNVAYLVAEMFLRKDSQGRRANAKQITVEVNKLYPSYAFKRESVYPHVARAVELGFVRFVPPVDRALSSTLALHFHLDPGAVHVVDTPTEKHGSMVAAHAADPVLEKIRDRARHPPGHPVGLGLGPGRAALDFSERLAERLRTEPVPPSLGLYAITGGGPATMPHFAPASFFGLFPDACIVERIGMFTESLVRNAQFDEIKRQPGVKEAFKARQDGKIHIILTSMGDMDDKDDLARRYLLDAGVKEKELKKLGWRGNVQYRPYTAEGPAPESGDQFRAATLFEIPDLVDFAARKDQHVILIARRCGLCGATHEKALEPLLTNPRLRVFSELVTDAATARALLRTARR